FPTSESRRSIKKSTPFALVKTIHSYRCMFLMMATCSCLTVETISIKGATRAIPLCCSIFSAKAVAFGSFRVTKIRLRFKFVLMNFVMPRSLQQRYQAHLDGLSHLLSLQQRL